MTQGNPTGSAETPAPSFHFDSRILSKGLRRDWTDGGNLLFLKSVGTFLSEQLPSCCLKVEKVIHSHYRCRLSYFPNILLSFSTCLLSTPTSGCPFDALTTIKLEKKFLFSIITSITGKVMVQLGYFYIVGSKKKIITPLEANMTSHFKSYKKCS